MFLQKINIIYLYNNNRNRETFKTNKTYFYSFQHGVVRQRRVVFLCLLRYTNEKSIYKDLNI